MKKKSIIFITLVIIAIFVSGCSNSGGVEESKISKIMVYVSGPEKMINKLENAYEKEAGDKVEFLIMSCGQVRHKIWAEKEAGEIQADFVLGSSPVLYNQLDSEKLLMPLSLDNMEKLPLEYQANDHNYCFFNERYISILASKSCKNDLPKSYKAMKNKSSDLLMVIADPRQSATALGISSALYQLNDSDINYFNDLKERGLKLTKSNGQVPSLIMDGQYDYGIAPYDSYIRLKNIAKKDNYELSIKAYFPDEGAISIKRPMGIIKKDNYSNEKIKELKKLANFILSKEAQKITMDYGFVSVRKDIPNNFLPDGVKKIETDWELATKNESEFKEKFGKIFR